MTRAGLRPAMEGLSGQCPGASGAMLNAVCFACFLQGEPPLALGLSTRKALGILKEQLETVLEGHLKERKKCLTWKVKLLPGEAGAEVGWQRGVGGPGSGPGAGAHAGRRDPTEASLQLRRKLGQPGGVLS